MANKTLITRIQNKIDELGSWKAVESTFKPLRGEICIVEIPSGDPTATTAPTCLIKIGNGEDFFKDLTYLSAPAADVYSWAKKSETDFKAWVKTLVTVDDINLDDYVLKTDVEAVHAQVETNKTNIAELTTNLGTANENIGKNTTAIAELTTTHTNDKAALEESIADAKKAGTDANSALEAYKTSNDAAVAKTLTDAKAYTDTEVGKVNTAVATFASEIKDGDTIDSFKDVETALAGKQASGDYATKSEAQGYANAKDDAIAEAKKAGTDAQAAVNALTAEGGAVAVNASNIAELQTAVENLGTTADSTYEKKTDAAQKLTDAKAYTDELANGQVKLNKEAIEKLNGDSTVEGSVDKKIADAINTFATEVTDNGAIDKFAELVTYVNNHGGEAAEMATAIETLETKMGGKDAKSVATQISEAIAAENLGQYAKDSDLDALETTVSNMDTAYKAADEAINTELAKKATTEALNGAVTRIGTLETEMDTAEGKIKALEDVGSEKNVIVSVKVNGTALTPDANRAVDVTVPTGALASKDKVAKSDLATELATELDAKATEADLTIAEGRISENETDIANLQKDTHTHSNKALLDTYTQTEANLADAVAKKHEHTNKTVLDDIDADDITTWNTVTEKAKASDLTAVGNRVTALEDRIGFDGDVLIFDCGTSTRNV